ncbi:telomere-associated protein Tap [Streptomyces sp. NPDC059578]|uniref:telomere-associated protein Tap n=1 Tax=Streptomyces sp. NPDC059578 TaxID=3346874 RepID=UPI00368398B9
MSELFDAVDALIAGQSPLPPPAERERLRKAHGLTQDQVATALKVRRPTIVSWESGKTEPRPPQREAYARLLEKLAELYPATPAPAPVSVPAPTPVPEAFTGPMTPEPVADAGPVPAAPAAGSAPVQELAVRESTRPTVAPPAAARPAATARPTSSSRRPAARKAAPAKNAAPAAAPGGAGVDARFGNGPLAVLDADADGKVSAYCTGGLVLDVPAKSLPSLVAWTLKEAKLGAPRLHPLGKDADPLLVLTAAAAVRYGLPEKLTDEERQAGRLPEGHKVVKQLAKAEWQLTQRGFGPWARIYRPAENGVRRCVQLAIVSWDALDVREWGNRDRGWLPTKMEAPELARILGTYAARVLTPRGTTAVSGLELMTSLRPPSRRVRDEVTGEFKLDAEGKPVRERIPGSISEELLDVVPCEVPDEHPKLVNVYPRHHVRTAAEALMEEPFNWSRPFTDAEYEKRFVVGIDVNTAFLAAANGLVVGLGAPQRVKSPRFDPKLPGSWLVDLSHVELDERLPSPFTPRGTRPEGPAWYATPTVAYAVELGYQVKPAEAYVRPDSARYLDPWYKTLRDAYVATMADLGVVAGMDEQDFLDAMAGHKDVDPGMTLVLTAIKATAKGAVGKMRERPRGGRPGEPWPALNRPLWRPDIRAAIISTTRVNLHRKLMKTAAAAGLYPVAIGTDCIIYPSDGPSPLDFLPRTPDGKPLPGGFRLGVSPGMVKWEGTQTMLWAEGLREKHGPDINIAGSIKDGAPADTGE